MTNNAKLRNNLDKRSRPKSWCVTPSRVDPAMIKSMHGSSRQKVYCNDRYVEGKGKLDDANHEFVYRRFSAHGNTHRRDSNNNCSNENIRNTGKRPSVIKRTNVDKAHRRTIVSLNLGKDYSPPTENYSSLRPKRNRPKSLHQNFFRRSCNILKSHVFRDNSKNEAFGESFKSNAPGLGPFRESSDLSSNEYCSILTDGESCIFSNLHFPSNEDYVNQGPWTLWNSEDDVYQGYSLGTGESLSDSVGNINPTEAYISNLMPWTKRTNSMPNHEVIPIESFQCRRDNRKYSSLRSPTKSKISTASSPSTKEHSNYDYVQFSPHKRHSHENIRMNRSGSARYYRPNSMDSALRKKMINTQDRIIDDNIKNLNSRTLKSKKGEKGNAPNFFIRYQDILREEKITDTPPPISYYDSSKFTQINEVFEYLLNLHCSKPVTKTCKQLFYIRSRLSKNARRNDSMCDGCFGCDKENSVKKHS